MTMRVQEGLLTWSQGVNTPSMDPSQDPCKIAVFCCLSFFVPLIQSQDLFISGASGRDCVVSLLQYLEELEFTYWLQEDH